VMKPDAEKEPALMQFIEEIASQVAMAMIAR